jgi:hypothetical protein
MPDVAAALFAPLTGDPNGSAMRRTAIDSRNPDIAVAVPAVVAGNPDVTFVWRSGNDLNRARWRWADTDDDLRVSCANREKESRYSDKEIALYVQDCLLLLSDGCRRRRGRLPRVYEIRERNTIPRRCTM